MPSYWERTAGDLDLSPPPAYPVTWIATNKKTGETVEVKHQLGYYAKKEAMVLLQCEPDDVTLQRKDKDERPENTTGTVPGRQDSGAMQSRNGKG